MPKAFTTLAKGLYAACALSLAVVSLPPAAFAAPNYREPTEAEMRQALENQLAGASSALTELREKCKHLDPNAGPMLAMQCLAVIAPPPPVKITSFEKLNCGEVTTGGYSCDYIIALDLGPMLTQGLVGKPEAAHKRFVKSATRGWIALPD